MIVGLPVSGGFYLHTNYHIYEPPFLLINIIAIYTSMHTRERERKREEDGGRFETAVKFMCLLKEKADCLALAKGKRQHFK
jgi:hypothetical protein